jgi:uncharacterized protein YbjT (DUF2867 family)
MNVSKPDQQKALRVIVTGATGMVGEGVMKMCLDSPDVAEVLSVSRRPSGHTHPKLREVLHDDFFLMGPVADQLQGYDACFFCLGVSSVGMPKVDYYRYTYTLTMHFAETLSLRSPGLRFCYVSGAGTSLRSRLSWAQVKGKVEQDLQLLPFGGVFNYRPGFIRPIKGLKHAHKAYRYINWFFPIGRALFPNAFCTLAELGRSMIRAARGGYPGTVLEGKDIIATGRPS